MKIEEMINKVILSDCLDILKILPDKSIDLVLTDPPYGINADKGVGWSINAPAKRYIGNWDNKIPSKEIFDEILRVGKKVIIFGGNYFTESLPQNNHWIVWDKIGEMKLENLFSNCELAWTNITNLNTVKKYFVRQVGFINDGDERIHPTQKPYRLMVNILNDYTEEGQIVLDCFSGSGTIAVACKDNNRKFIAIEINESFYKKSINRLKGIKDNGQLSIFTDEKTDYELIYK